MLSRVDCGLDDTPLCRRAHEEQPLDVQKFEPSLDDLHMLGEMLGGAREDVAIELAAIGVADAVIVEAVERARQALPAHRGYAGDRQQFSEDGAHR